MKKLKLAFKGQVTDADRKNKQHSWQAFQSKKKSSKKSMFASSDSVDGKVGVTGSGQGVTSFESRKRHKFTR